MMIDHVGAIWYQPYLLTLSDPQPWMLTVYYAMRAVGRIAFPLYCFLLVEGFFHTRHVFRYAGRLFLFALISEIPFDLAVGGNCFVWSDSNVFFTLLLGLCAMIAVSYTERFFTRPPAVRRSVRVFLGTAAVLAECAAACLAADLLGSDYGAFGVAVILMFRFFRRNRVLACAAGVMMLIRSNFFSIASFSTAALPFVYCYSGEKGVSMKYFFYAFYPAHLLLLTFVAHFWV
jgi:hypothetical protein